MKKHSSHETPVEGLDYYGERSPVGEPGGDFFEFLPLQPQLLVSIGDISRHGVGTNIILSGLQTLLRRLSVQKNGELPQLVEGLNRSMCDISPENFYATLFYVRIDPVLRQLRYVSAGHEPALLFHRRSNRPRRLERTGTVLGLTARANYRQHTLSMEPGDTLVAFTEGITEAAVLRALEEYPDADARELSGCILEAVETVPQSSPAADDRTVVVVRLVDRSAVRPVTAHSEELACAAA